MAPSPLTKVRRIALSLPDTEEVRAWGEATWRVRQRMFAMFASNGTHHAPEGVPCIWVNTSKLNQEFMIADQPKRFFSPPYAGAAGWVGMRLDRRVSWKFVAEVVRDGYEYTLEKARGKKKR